MKIKYKDVFTTSFLVDDESAFEQEPLIKKLIAHCSKVGTTYKLKNNRYLFSIRTNRGFFPRDLDRKLRSVIQNHMSKEEICMIKTTALHKGEVSGFRCGIVGSGI